MYLLFSRLHMMYMQHHMVYLVSPKYNNYIKQVWWAAFPHMTVLQVV